MSDESRPPEVESNTRYAKVTFITKEFGPDESGHAQPWIAIEFHDLLTPEVDGTHGHLSLHFRNQRMEIGEADRIAAMLRDVFSEASLLMFDPGDLAAQRQWLNALWERHDEHSQESRDAQDSPE